MSDAHEPGDPVEEEQALQRSFQLDDGAGPALPLSSKRAAALVERAIIATRRPRGTTITFRRPWLVGVGVVVAATGAAAYDLGQRLWGPSESEQPVAQQREEAPARSPFRSPPPTGSAQGAAPEESAREQGKQEEQGATPPEQATEAPKIANPAPQGSTRRVQDNAAPVSDPAAIDKLRRANQARKARRYDEALKLYLEVVDTYPHSLQAQAARVSAASLTLEHQKDPDRARELYDDANRRGGQLSEEASYGLAETHRRSGDEVAERQALERFLRRYPKSPLARVARKRLQTLLDSSEGN